MADEVDSDDMSVPSYSSDEDMKETSKNIERTKRTSEMKVPQLAIPLRRASSRLTMGQHSNRSNSSFARDTLRHSHRANRCIVMDHGASKMRDFNLTYGNDNETEEMIVAASRATRGDPLSVTFQSTSGRKNVTMGLTEHRKESIDRLSKRPNKTSKYKFASENERQNCVFKPKLSNASRRAIARLGMASGENAFIERMEAREKQRRENIAEQARHLDALQNRNRKQALKWGDVSKDFFQRLEQYQQGNNEHTESKMDTPHDNKDAPNWNSVRDDFFERYEEDLEIRQQHLNSIKERLDQNAPKHSFQPNILGNSRLVQDLPPFEERTEADIEKRHEFRKQYDDEIERSRYWLEHGVQKSAHKAYKRRLARQVAE